jgi:hypothetical protein
MRSPRWSSRVQCASTKLVSFGLTLFFCAVSARAGILAGNCRVATQPAATLLIPYFTTDLNQSVGNTTIISVSNAWSSPALARVVFWTDWGVPTLAFDVYLTGFDVERFDVRAIFSGTLPATSPSISPQGQYSETGTPFPGCTGDLTNRQAQRAATLDSSAIAYLRAAHTGQPLPATQANAAAASRPMCASTSHPSGVVSGYITIDAVNQCSATAVGTATTTPADPAYFAHGGKGIASDDNVLWGDAVYLGPAGRPERSMAAVSLVADPDVLSAGSYTFYGRYSNFGGLDDRVPLSSLYYVRFDNEGGPMGTSDLIVWRDPRNTSVAPVACGTEPSWSHMGEEQLLVFDEEENGLQIAHSDAFPYATQVVPVGGASLPTTLKSGFVMLDLWKADSTHAQAWVGVANTVAGGRFNSGHDAVRIDDLCNFGP